MKSLVRTSNLYKSYHDGSRELTVLRGIEMDVRAGETLAIVGSSGSGKSTLLHLLGALDLPTKGTVELDGADTSKLSREKLARLRRKHSGFIFQFHHLLQEFTAVENVMIPMLADNVSKGPARKRAMDLLDRVGLSERTTHHSNQLSGGEQQRVAIARALANDPTLILADEPTGNLDEETGLKVSNLLFDLVKNLEADKARSLILVTHDKKMAQRADRVLHLTNGQLEIEKEADKRVVVEG